MGLDISEGEIVGLIGPNGAGKTTFINCIAGTYQPSSGTVAWQGRELRGLAPHAVIRQGVARTFQNVASLHDLTVLDIVKLGAGARGGASPRDAARAFVRGEAELEAELHEAVLGPLRLSPIAAQPIQTLSYGLRKAVDLARALASRPRLLLLDEPVAGLTAQEGRQMAGVIREVRDRTRCAVLMVEHKMDVVMSTCDRIAVMAAGAKIFEGTGAEVQADPEVRRVYLGEP
ncbi:MAG: ABC transporter ATP-binding protein [Deltaproteobacteria bacterium]|nr:ABC transporter ATP-binding protein [Deltaproteobacteria bacterium]